MPLKSLCPFFKSEGLNSPYLGSFSFCGLKNLNLPSSSVSIRWLYECSAKREKTFIKDFITDHDYKNTIFSTMINGEYPHMNELRKPSNSLPPFLFMLAHLMIYDDLLLNIL